MKPAACTRPSWRSVLVALLLCRTSQSFSLVAPSNRAASTKRQVQSVITLHAKPPSNRSKRIRRRISGLLFSSPVDDNDEPTTAAVAHQEPLQVNGAQMTQHDETQQQQQREVDVGADTARRTLRNRVGSLARNIVVKPISQAYSMPKAVAEVLKDATISAVDLAVEEVFRSNSEQQSLGRSTSSSSSSSQQSQADLDITAIVEEAFAPMEQSLDELEESLQQARKSHKLAKSHAHNAMEAIQAAAIAQAEAAVTAVSRAEEVAERIALVEYYASTNNVNSTDLSLEDIDFATSEMAPPFLDEDQCLVPGEPVVRVEKALENSRRIFAGIDVMAEVDDVWKVLTDYEHLENVVPNLLVNDVLKLHPGVPISEVHVDQSQPDTNQCREIAEQMKGAELRQVGGAKVVGINFSARTTLEVREWPQGLPDFAHFQDDVWQGKSRKERAKDYATAVKLERYRFPRPFAVSKLPTRDITMQSVEDDDGEFRMYQGVWRMQPLPGCAPDGQDAMRLTYAVEVSPRSYLPVQLIEGRIVKDLCTNLKAIRDFVEASKA